ncbi:MAG: hypothetical protein AAGG75_22640 [Bacteroidota bacterium]
MEIQHEEYRTIIRFYEEYRQEITQLDFEEYFELLLAYTKALFEIGAYGSFVEVVDNAIGITIEHNIHFYQGEDIYQELLFRKAAAYYNLHEFDKSKYILRELIKIDPWNQLTIRFLKKCLRGEKSPYLRSARAISVVLFFIAAVIIAVEILFVSPVYPEYVMEVRLARNLFFLSGVGTLLIGEAINYWRIYSQTEAFARQARSKKHKNSDS